MTDVQVKKKSWQELWQEASLWKKSIYVAHLVLIVSLSALVLSLTTYDEFSIPSGQKSLLKGISATSSLILILAFVYGLCGGWRSLLINIILIFSITITILPIKWVIIDLFKGQFFSNIGFKEAVIFICFAFDYGMLCLIQRLLGMVKRQRPVRHVRKTLSSVIKDAQSYTIGVLKAACFSIDAQNHFNNSKGAALWSFLIPLVLLLYLALIFSTTLPELKNTALYPNFDPILYVIILSWQVLIITPKFLIFHGLVWQICKASRQTDYFWAFVTASNWYYVVYTLILAAQVGTSKYFHITFDHWEQILAGYFAIALYFLAQNILRLTQEFASLVALAYVFTHILILLVTGKHGLMVVF